MIIKQYGPVVYFLDDSDSPKITVCVKAVRADDVLVIQEFGKCGTISGQLVMDSFLAFAKQDNGIHAVVVELDDSSVSSSGVDVSLFKLSMLSNGESWYNKLGFYPSALVPMNNEFLRQIYAGVVTIGEKDDIYTIYSQYMSNPLDKILLHNVDDAQRQHILERLRILANHSSDNSTTITTIQEVFSATKRGLKNNMYDPVEVREIANILAKVVIPYEEMNLHNLRKEIRQRTIAGGRLRRRLTRRKKGRRILWRKKKARNNKSCRKKNCR